MTGAVSVISEESLKMWRGRAGLLLTSDLPRMAPSSGELPKKLCAASRPATFATLRFAIGEQALVQRTERTMAIVMPDRTLLIWASSMEELETVEEKTVDRGDLMNGKIGAAPK